MQQFIENLAEICIFRAIGWSLHFLGNYRVDITVWKSLWRMCKTHGAGTFSRVTVRLWEILRNNISVKFL